MTNKIPPFHIFAMVVLLLSPILSLYGNPEGWSFEMLLTIPPSIFFFLYYILTKRDVLGEKDPLPDGLLIYFVYYGLLLTIMSFIFPLSIIQSYLVFLLFFATFHLPTFLKMYKGFALICIALFFIQEISFYVTGNRVVGIITALPMHFTMRDQTLAEIQLNAMRSSSFFAEPAHFAQFLLPLLAIELFYDKNKRHNLFAIIIGIVLLLLQSGNGLFGLVTILFFALFYYMRETKRNKFLIVLLYLILISVAAYFFINSSMGDSVIGRQEELSMNYEGGSMSGFARIWRGYYVFNDYNFLEMIFGCPDISTQLSHVRASGFIIGSSAELYFNCFQKFLLNTGFIGVGFFIYIIVRLWRNNTYCGKALLATFIVLSFMAAIYLSHTMVLFIVLAKSMKKEYLNNY